MFKKDIIKWNIIGFIFLLIGLPTLVRIMSVMLDLGITQEEFKNFYFACLSVYGLVALIFNCIVLEGRK